MQLWRSRENRFGFCADGAPGVGASYVLYWAQMNRRVRFNHALLHAAELTNHCGLPLLVYEGLTCTYTADGVAELAARCEINQSIAPSTCFRGGQRSEAAPGVVS